MYDDAASSQNSLNARYGRSRAQSKLFIWLVGIGFASCLGANFALADAAASAREEANEFARAARAFDLKDYGDAAARFQRLSLRVAKNDLYHFNYAAALIHLDRWEEAEAELKQAIRLRGEYFYPSVLYLADLMRQTRREDQARKLLTWLLARKNLPQSFAREVKLASRGLEETQRWKDDYAELMNLAILRRKQNRLPEAISYCHGALQRRRTWEAELLLALLSLEAGRFSDAQILLNRLVVQEEDLELAKIAQNVMKNYRTDLHGKFWLNGEYLVESESGYVPGYKAQSVVIGTGAARLGYRFVELEEWRLQTDYQFRWSQIFAGPSTTMFVQHLNGRVDYATNRWNFGTNLGTELSTFSDRSFLLRFISGWTAAHRWQDSRLLAAIQGHANRPLAPAYRYLNGYGAVGKLDFTYYIEPATFSLYTFYGVDLSGNSEISPSNVIPLDNLQNGAGEQVAFALSRYWFVRQGAGLAKKRYRGNVKPGESVRLDTLWFAQLGLGFKSRDPYFFNLDGFYLVNKSNIDRSFVSDQNYRELSVRASLVWEFLP